MRDRRVHLPPVPLRRRQPRGQPPASGSDTQQIVLEVCQEEGLQQVIWLSRPFAGLAVDVEQGRDVPLAIRHGWAGHGCERPPCETEGLRQAAE
jgi:hypothetical protein